MAEWLMQWTATPCTRVRFPLPSPILGELMFDMIIYLVTYEGQTESAYTWEHSTWQGAEKLMGWLQEEFPEREWSIIEKDVS